MKRTQRRTLLTYCASVSWHSFADRLVLVTQKAPPLSKHPFGAFLDRLLGVPEPDQLVYLDKPGFDTLIASDTGGAGADDYGNPYPGALSIRIPCDLGICGCSPQCVRVIPEE